MYRLTAHNAVYANGGITLTFFGCVWINTQPQAAAIRMGWG